MHGSNYSTLEDIHNLAVRTLRFDSATARQARIGQSLRNVYDCAASEPVPDEFQKLIDQLDSVEKPS